MGLKVGVLLLLLISLVMAASSFKLDDVGMVATMGRVGDLIDTDEEAMMGSESARRTLAGQQRYISYGALKANNVPCSKRGRSYYGCNVRGRANPYNRGCSFITHCARYSGR